MIIIIIIIIIIIRSLWSASAIRALVDKLKNLKISGLGTLALSLKLPPHCARISFWLKNQDSGLRNSSERPKVTSITSLLFYLLSQKYF